MSKLEEIESYFATSVNRAREPQRQGEYEDWLIARVRKLESRLALAHRRIEMLRAELLWFADCDNSADWIRADAALEADNALAKEK